MADSTNLTLFNDGEGLDEADINKLQNTLDQRVTERGFRVGGLAGTFNLSNASSGNPNGPFSDARPIGLSASRIITPDPLTFTLNTFTINVAGELTLDTGNFLFCQRSGAVAGVDPDGLGGSFGDLLSYIPDDSEVAEVGNARPAVNPRWDSLDLAIAHATSGPESRDVEDAATRALTTELVNKVMERTLLQGYNQGAESATPTYPALTAGYGRYITILRETAEAALNQANVRLHAFPGKLRIERVPGHELWHGDPANFGQDPARYGGLDRLATDTGSGTVLAIPRNMHAGSRLVGVGASFRGFTNDLAIVDVVRLDEGTAGLVTISSVLNLLSIFSTSVNGYTFAGLADFVDAQGNELPIWGNGFPYGPLFSTKEAAPVTGVKSEQLAFRVADASGWVAGDCINYVEFYYLD